ncbi:MAG: hypothetical protein ACHP9V_05165 [Terriglobales bacterium]
MPSKRPNLTRTSLTLDEKSFQDLLSAAFTIQEHSEHLKQTQRAQAETEAKSVCPHCGALKSAEGARCQRCGLDELRPGERLQRNWASMWLMSQEQGLGLERPSESGEATGKDVPATRRPQAPAVRDSGGNGHAALPVAKAAAQETTTPEKDATSHDQGRARSVIENSVLEKSVPEKSALDDPAQGEVETRRAWPLTASEDLAREDLVAEDLGPEDSDLAVETYQLSANDDFSPDKAATAARPDAELYLSAGDDASAGSLLQRLADLRVTLRFHRADLYLGLSIFVAAVALLWPTPASPRRGLSPWERALVTIGIAEAPAPVAHFQGDPGVEVWVDPHTALYYCPGEEQYGKTADGRLTSQRDAQMDRFQPSGRSVCE